MELYGPFNLVANTPLRVQVSMLTRGVRVLNGSQFDLHVSFSPPGTQPTAAGPFNVAVGPRGRESFTLPPMLTQGGRWGGDLWVYPTLSTGQVVSPVVNTSAVVRVEGYGGGESLPQSTAVGTAYDQTSQARNVMLPVTPGSLAVVQGSHVASIFAQGFDVLCQLPPTTMPSATQAWNPYVYALSLVQSGALWVQIQIAFAVEHAGGGYSIYGTGVFAGLGMRLWAGVPWSPVILPYTSPTIPILSTDLGLFLVAGNLASYPTATTPTYDGSVQCTTDTTGQGGIPGIGSGAQTLAGTFY